MRYVKTVKETGVTRTRSVAPFPSHICSWSDQIYTSSRARVRLLHDEPARDRNTLSQGPRQLFSTPQRSPAYSASTHSVPRARLITQYKIELRVRNHTTIPRTTLIQSIASCVPPGNTVDLQNPQIFILCEVFKVCNSEPNSANPFLIFNRAYSAYPSSRATMTFKNSMSWKFRASLTKKASRRRTARESKVVYKKFRRPAV